MTGTVGQIMSVTGLDKFCRRVLEAAGASPTHAAIGAEALVMADSWGVSTHGSKLLRGYLRRLQAGGLQSDREPIVEREGMAWGLIDGQSVLGHVSGKVAMQLAITKAREAGVAYVGVRNSCHFGAAGYYAALAAQHDCIGIAMANDIPSVAAPGSRGAITGSNPFAYAIPAGAGRDPIMLDVAMSTVAGGKVYAAVARGESIPNNWIIGPDGEPTQEGSLYPHHATLVPFGAHKGYGLALLIESLSAIVTGAAMTWKVGSWIFGDPAVPTDHGAAFLAIDPSVMGSRDEFYQRVGALIDEIHAAPTVAGVDRVLVPGEMEWSRRQRALAHGIPMPSDVMDVLSEVARDYRINLSEFLYDGS